MRKTILTAAAALTLVAPLTAQDPVTAPAPATPAPSSETATMERAGMIFDLFATAVDSDEIAVEEKGILIGCLYSNTLQTISETVGQALASNPDIDATNPTNVYVLAARICGVADVPPAAPEEATR